MDKFLDYIIPLIVSSVLAVGGFIMKNIFGRLDTLEDKMSKTVTEQEVRTLLSDKLDPLKEDVHEIKQAMIKIYELYLSERK